MQGPEEVGGGGGGLLRETVSGVGGGSHPGRGPDTTCRCRSVRLISLSPTSLRKPGGGASSGNTDQEGPGVPTLEWIFFPDQSPRAKPYCGVKRSQWLPFPATDFGTCACRGTIPSQ